MTAPDEAVQIVAEELGVGMDCVLIEFDQGGYVDDDDLMKWSNRLVAALREHYDLIPKGTLSEERHSDLCPGMIKYDDHKFICELDEGHGRWHFGHEYDAGYPMGSRPGRFLSWPLDGARVTPWEEA